jgi:phenylalanyl-tRNA synthetase beta chain
MQLCNVLAVISDDIKHESIRFEEKQATHSYEHPVNLNAVYCGNTEIGEIGIVHPIVSKKIDKKAAIVFAEIDVEAFAKIADNGIVYDEPSRYPEMEVDLTFVADLFAPIGKAIEAVKSALVKKVSVVDTYTDENGKAITVRIIFADKSKTLKREDVSAVTDKITEALKSENIFLKD